MAKKLENVKAVQQLLDGTHKFQTKKSFNFTPGKVNQRREVGETWEEVDPKTGNTYVWEQKEGYRVRHGNLDSVRQALQEMKMPSTCPNCGDEMIKPNLDKKMWNIHKMCFDCVIDMEAKLRYEGKFEEYARNLMYRNANDWFKDADSEVRLIKEALAKESIEYVNADGKLETWSQVDREKWLKKIDEDYEQFKKDILTRFAPKENDGN